MAALHSVIASQRDPMAFVEELSQALLSTTAAGPPRPASASAGMGYLRPATRSGAPGPPSPSPAGGSSLAGSAYARRPASSGYTSLIRYFGRPILPPKLTPEQRTEMAVLRAQAVRRQMQRSTASTANNATATARPSTTTADQRRPALRRETYTVPYGPRATSPPAAESRTDALFDAADSALGTPPRRLRLPPSPARPKSQVSVYSSGEDGYDQRMRSDTQGNAAEQQPLPLPPTEVYPPLQLQFRELPSSAEKTRTYSSARYGDGVGAGDNDLPLQQAANPVGDDGTSAPFLRRLQHIPAASDDVKSWLPASNVAPNSQPALGARRALLDTLSATTGTPTAISSDDVRADLGQDGAFSETASWTLTGSLRSEPPWATSANRVDTTAFGRPESLAATLTSQSRYYGSTATSLDLGDDVRHSIALMTRMPTSPHRPATAVEQLGQHHPAPGSGRPQISSSLSSGWRAATSAQQSRSLTSLVTLDSRHQAASRLTAAARGYLLRRMLATERIQGIVKMIKDAAIFLQELEKTGIESKDDQVLYDRTAAHLRASRYQLQELLVDASPSRRLQLLYHQRELELERERQRRGSRAPAGREQHRISEATQRARQRKQSKVETEKRTGVPRSWLEHPSLQRLERDAEIRRKDEEEAVEVHHDFLRKNSGASASGKHANAPQNRPKTSSGKPSSSMPANPHAATQPATSDTSAESSPMLVAGSRLPVREGHHKADVAQRPVATA